MIWFSSWERVSCPHLKGSCNQWWSNLFYFPSSYYLSSVKYACFCSCFIMMHPNLKLGLSRVLLKERERIIIKAHWCLRWNIVILLRSLHLHWNPYVYWVFRRVIRHVTIFSYVCSLFNCVPIPFLCQALEG